MEVVCLILGPMLTSRPCSHTFWVLTSLHLLPFLLKMFFIIFVNIEVMHKSSTLLIINGEREKLFQAHCNNSTCRITPLKLNVMHN